MPLLRVLLTPEEKRQRTKELRHEYYLKNKEKYLEYQRAYRAMIGCYTEAQKRSIYKQRAKIKAPKLEK